MSFGTHADRGVKWWSAVSGHLTAALKFRRLQKVVGSQRKLDQIDEQFKEATAQVPVTPFLTTETHGKESMEEILTMRS